jgi:hypothetical protein
MGTGAGREIHWPPIGADRCHACGEGSVLSMAFGRKLFLQFWSEERGRQAKVGPVKPQLAAAGLLGTRRKKTPPIPGPI